MISGYKIATEMVAVYDMEACKWVGHGTVDIFKKEVGEEPVTEHFSTEEVVEESSDEVFDMIATAVERLLWDSKALDEGDLTDDD